MQGLGCRVAPFPIALTGTVLVRDPILLLLFEYVYPLRVALWWLITSGGAVLCWVPHPCPCHGDPQGHPVPNLRCVRVLNATTEVPDEGKDRQDDALVLAGEECIQNLHYSRLPQVGAKVQLDVSCPPVLPFHHSTLSHRLEHRYCSHWDGGLK